MRWNVGFLVTLVAALASLAGCGGDTVPGPTPEPVAQVDLTMTTEIATPQANPTPTPTEVTATSTPDLKGENALAVVEAFDTNDEDAVHRLNEVAAEGGDIVPALAPLLEDDDPNRRWAALYLIASATDTEEEIAVLEPILQDEHEIFRVMAAAALSDEGVVESIPVLIQGLESEEQIPFSDPPRPLAAMTQMTLEHVTGERFETLEEWQTWWQDVEGTLIWNGGRYAVQ